MTLQDLLRFIEHNRRAGQVLDIDSLDPEKHAARLRRDAQADADREAERNDGRLR